MDWSQINLADYHKVYSLRANTKRKSPRSVCAAGAGANQHGTRHHRESQCMHSQNGIYSLLRGEAASQARMSETPEADTGAKL